ncbi:general stress protein 26 [Luteococcus japonicus]|uniref:General stress protein 26 n=1 Tax=Luteococcus japonicus TaxID=33984 RepID=A0A3N1ZQK8_9ACTN|nr:pyridoxamine 5'-phosphate oxidase family protein [Luteococcus japonicus]ROR52958.1 general stress protein 26 [Luteococcus japonicus]
MTQSSAGQQKIRDLIKDIRFAMLATTEAGRVMSRPMTPLRIEDDLTILFITQRSTDVAQQADAQGVNLAFVDSGTFVSLTGTGELRDDVELKKQLWNVATTAHTDSGPEDPENVVLAVVPDSASYWDSDAAPVAVFTMLKAAVTGEKAHSGEHGTVDL